MKQKPNDASIQNLILSALSHEEYERSCRTWRSSRCLCVGIYTSPVMSSNTSTFPARPWCHSLHI